MARRSSGERIRAGTSSFVVNRVIPLLFFLWRAAASSSSAAAASHHRSGTIADVVASTASSSSALPNIMTPAARPWVAAGRRMPSAVAAATSAVARVPAAFRPSPRRGSDRAAFVVSSGGGRVRMSSRPSISHPRTMAMPPSHRRGNAFFRSFARHRSVSTCVGSPSSSTPSSLSSSRATDDRRAATPPSPAASSPPDDGSFPKWWPASVSGSPRNHISIEDHVAHVIVPNVAGGEHDADGTISPEDATTLTCEGVVRWVLRAAGRDDAKSPADDDARRSRIEQEWTEGEEASSTADAPDGRVLDPSHRHDPSLLPQTPGARLIAHELLALGSVWRLPLPSSSGRSAATPAVVDRFDPSSGAKPTRLTVGDANATANPGDYFRVHFDPRRFVDANRYDWGAFVDDAGGDADGAKPGVIASRDDEAGYVAIDKPPNVPAHARVDNALENVAACVGRALWEERRRRVGDGGPGRAASPDEEGGGDGIADATNATEADGGRGGRRRRRRTGRRRRRNQKKEPLVYVGSPQRLDQNTSGLLVVATKKSFAAYFAKLLRTKTTGQLIQNDVAASSSSSRARSSSCGVHKTYRCLVCISPPQNDDDRRGGGEAAAAPSAAGEVGRLRRHVNATMRHYLEPSIRAPKRFAATAGDESWAECLLRIANVGEACTVVGNAPSESLARALWGDYGKPDGCVAVAECDVELLTGRTHQIRGQLAAEGFPLVGDVQYGGAVPNTSSLWKERCKGRAESFLDSERLALQCCSLEFLDPHRVSRDGSKDEVIRSKRWNSFRLDRAFWTPFVDRYREESARTPSSEATSALAIEESLPERAKIGLPPEDASAVCEPPPKVSLSQGSNKYVAIRAVPPERSDGENNEQWFVRSASPEECGGPYHANVAESLLQQLRSLGYEAAVVGGGRIDYLQNEEVSHAHVFGFSYGFGKGDHERVAAIIERNTNIDATFDNSDGLY